MTIKEMESVTGMGRANIRYYEAEGLITPERNRENGYRIYSQEDVAALRKIRLLRTLDVSIEEIRALQAGEISLEQVLERQVEELARKEQWLERSGQVLRQMMERKEEFDTMDAQNYLNALEENPVPAQDVQHRLNLPWRRYWARCLDFAIYMLLVDRIMESFPRWSYLSGLFYLAAMLVMEPLMLSLFATTPGKAIFGIRVTDPEGGRLSYGNALVRTWTVMWEGEAMRIPLVSLYFQFKSLSAAENDQTLSWEWDSDLTFRDDKLWRYAVYFTVLFAVEGLSVWLAL